MCVNELKNRLKNIAIDTLKKCETTIKPIGIITRSYHIHVPSGDMKYPSFWIRDASMMAESGLIETSEIHDWIELICLYGQNGCESIELENGLNVPPWCIADHINFDGGAVFYPGTYSSSNNQGDGSFGFFPPHDDQYYFINILYQYFQQTGETALHMFSPSIGKFSPLERAEKAFESYNIDEETGLCKSKMPYFTVDWGFCDSIVKSGLLLYPSLLRYRASIQLSEMLDSKSSEIYKNFTIKIRDSILNTFAASDGWLYSSTGLCSQVDVWGTAFAVWNGILKDEILQRAIKAMSIAYKNGMVSSNGYIRQIPNNCDYSETSAWEKTSFDKNIYQNGGFWSTPTGWYAYSLSLLNIEQSLQLLNDFAEHTQNHQIEKTPFEFG